MMGFFRDNLSFELYKEHKNERNLNTSLLRNNFYLISNHAQALRQPSPSKPHVTVPSPFTFMLPIQILLLASDLFIVIVKIPIVASVLTAIKSFSCLE